MELLSSILVNGLMTGSLYCLVAVGLTIVFGVMRILNFAHGEFYMLGAYIVWVLYALNGWPFPLALAVAGLAVGTLGVAIERSVYRRLRKQPMMVLIASLALASIMQVAVVLAVGPAWKSVPSAYTQIVSILGMPVTIQRVVVVVFAVALFLLLGFLLQRTKPGLLILASAEDSMAASLQGMSFDRSSTIAMFVGSAFAGIAGGLAAPLLPVHPWMGTLMIMRTFVIVIVGGAGSIPGALTIGYLLGFMESAIARLDPSLTVVFTLLVLLAVLIFKPDGIFGRG